MQCKKTIIGYKKCFGLNFAFLFIPYTNLINGKRQNSVHES